MAKNNTINTIIWCVLIGFLSLSCRSTDDFVKVSLHQMQVPVLNFKKNNPVLQIKMVVSEDTRSHRITSITVSTCTDDLTDIKTLRLFYLGKDSLLTRYETDIERAGNIVDPHNRGDMAKKGYPYPGSEDITDFQIDTHRISIGHGDNWANTWTNKDEIFSFFTDGKGLGTYTHKPSSAPIIITGTPPNIKAKDFEVTIDKLTVYGSGKNGRKVCGLVMINNILYAWVRNLNLPDSPKGTGSILIYSEDNGTTWTWADWNWPDIGYPVWLNAGKNYTDAQDEYAYFIAPDGPSAYADYPDIIMGRVNVTEILDKKSYKFYRKTHENEITWDSYENRTPVFTDSAGCFRPNLVYNPGIKKYLLSTCSPYGEWKWWANKNKTRIAHLGIFEADNPWGPWNTVYYEKDWGKPENRFAPNIPSKWIGKDGTTFYLIYSCIPNGPYQLNIQKCSIQLGNN